MEESNYKATAAFIFLIILALAITSCGFIPTDDLNERSGTPESKSESLVTEADPILLTTESSVSKTEPIIVITDPVITTTDSAVVTTTPTVVITAGKTTESVETTVPVVTPPVTDAEIKLISLTSPISPNHTATIEIKGKPDTRYVITVKYKSGASKADGLEAKTSDGDGYVSWSWDVGPRTSAGTFSITISGGGETFKTPFIISD